MICAGVFWFDADSPAALDRQLRATAVRDMGLPSLADSSSEDVHAGVMAWLREHPGEPMLLQGAACAGGEGHGWGWGWIEELEEEE